MPGLPGALPPRAGPGLTDRGPIDRGHRLPGRFDFDVPPEAIWRSIEHCERFEGWWAWLREFRLDGPGLEAGAVLARRGVPARPLRDAGPGGARPLRPPHGHRRHRARRPRGRRPPRARARRGGGTVAEVAWTVEMMQRPMRMAARVAHPAPALGPRPGRRGHRGRLPPAPASQGRSIPEGRRRGTTTPEQGRQGEADDRDILRAAAGRHRRPRDGGLERDRRSHRGVAVGTGCGRGRWRRGARTASTALARASAAAAARRWCSSPTSPTRVRPRGRGADRGRAGPARHARQQRRGDAARVHRGRAACRNGSAWSSSTCWASSTAPTPRCRTCCAPPQTARARWPTW